MFGCGRQTHKTSQVLGYYNSTVKPVLSGHRIKWTVAEVPKFISLIYLK